MSRYKFYQGLNFLKRYSPLGSWQKHCFKYRIHIYLISHGAQTQHHTQKVFSVEMFIFHRSIYLPRHELQPKTLDTRYEYLHTHTHTHTHTAHITRRATHLNTASALRARQLSIRSVLLSARNVIPHLYSYSFLIFFFFYSPLHSHCDSKGRAYLKLTPAPWYPLRIPTRYYSLPGMGSATWRTSTMNVRDAEQPRRFLHRSLVFSYSCIRPRRLDGSKAAQVSSFFF